MKFLIFILLSTLSSSALELYGTGARHYNVNAMGLAIGESFYFSDNINKVSGTSIATYWKSNLTRISFSNEFSSNLTTHSKKDMRVSSFSFTFPVSKYNGISFGLTPYTRSDIMISEISGYFIDSESSNFIDAVNSYSNYQISGGISSAYFAFSTKINKNNSLGFKLDRLFGNQFYTKKTIISELDYFSNNEIEYSEQDSTYKIVFNEFSGYLIQLDWLAEFNNHEVVLSATSMGPINVNQSIYINEYTSSNPYEPNNTFLNIESGDDLLQRVPSYSSYIEDDIDMGSFIENILNRINDYALGYHYSSGNFGVIAEYHRNDLFNNISLDNVNIFSYTKPSSASYHLGVYKSYINKKNVFWDTLHLRAGGYYKDLLFSDSEGHDTAITMGIGIDKDSNLIDFGIKFGKLSINSFEEENYVNAILSIEIGNRWFDNSRSME